MKKRTTVTFGHAGAAVLPAFGRNVSAVLERCLLYRHARCRRALRPLVAEGVSEGQRRWIALIVYNLAPLTSLGYSDEEMREKLLKEGLLKRDTARSTRTAFDDLCLLAEEYRLATPMVVEAVDAHLGELSQQSRDGDAEAS